MFVIIILLWLKWEEKSVLNLIQGSTAGVIKDKLDDLLPKPKQTELQSRKRSKTELIFFTDIIVNIEFIVFTFLVFLSFDSPRSAPSPYPINFTLFLFLKKKKKNLRKSEHIKDQQDKNYNKTKCDQKASPR